VGHAGRQSGLVVEVNHSHRVALLVLLDFDPEMGACACVPMRLCAYACLG
jgi:hypothetical protein